MATTVAKQQAQPSVLAVEHLVERRNACPATDHHEMHMKTVRSYPDSPVVTRQDAYPADCMIERFPVRLLADTRDRGEALSAGFIVTDHALGVLRAVGAETASLSIAPFGHDARAAG